MELPEGVSLENMKSLRELVGIRPTLHAVTEIGKLGELKALEIAIKEEPESRTGNWKELLHTCLQMCSSTLQVLVLRIPLHNLYSLNFMAHVPSGLRTYMCSGYFDEFPRWIDPSLSCLTVLSISLLNVHVQPEHLDKLAELPSLRFLRIQVLGLPLQLQEKLVIQSSPSAFPCLTDLRILCQLMFLKFQPGAMPKLGRLYLCFDARRTNEHFRTNNFNYGYENLPSLRHVVIVLNIIALNWAEHTEAQDAIRKTINNHPNHPSLHFSY